MSIEWLFWDKFDVTGLFSNCFTQALSKGEILIERSVRPH